QRCVATLFVRGQTDLVAAGTAQTTSGKVVGASATQVHLHAYVGIGWHNGRHGNRPTVTVALREAVDPHEADIVCTDRADEDEGPDEHDSGIRCQVIPVVAVEPIIDDGD